MVMRSKRVGVFKPSLLFLFLLLSCGVQKQMPSSSSLKVDGVSFDPLPTDVSIDCPYHILQGTQRFRGTYFIIPKLEWAKDANDKLMIKFLSSKNDKILFNFAISLDQGGAKTRENPKGCDFEKLRHSIDDHFTKVGQPENKVWALAPLPITNIEIRVDTLKQTKMLSPEGTNITTWLSEKLDLTLEITKDELEALLQKLSTGNGLQLVSTLKFEARETKEFGSLEIKGIELAQKLREEFKESGNLDNVTTVGIDLKARIERALKKINSQIVIEGGGDKLSAAAQSLFKLLLKPGVIDNVTKGKKPKKPKDDDDDDDDDPDLKRPKNPKKPDRDDDEDEDVKRKRKNPLPDDPFSLLGSIDQLLEKDDTDSKSKDDDEDGGNMLNFNIKAVIEFFEKLTNYQVQYRIMGSLVSENAAVRSPLLKGVLGSNDEKVFELSSHSKPISTSLDVTQGYKVTFYPLEKSTFESYSKETVSKYFSKNELLSLATTDNIQLEFATLTTWGRKLKEYTPNDFTGPRAYIYLSSWNLFNWSFFVFGRQDIVTAEKVKLNHEAIKIEDLDNIQFQFSKYARPFKASALVAMASNPSTDSAMPMKAYINKDGSYTLEAKENLGQLTLTNVENFPLRKYEKRKYFQELWTTYPDYKLTGAREFSKKVIYGEEKSGRSELRVKFMMQSVVPDVEFYLVK